MITKFILSEKVVLYSASAEGNLSASEIDLSQAPFTSNSQAQFNGLEHLSHPIGPDAEMKSKTPCHSYVHSLVTSHLWLVVILSSGMLRIFRSTSTDEQSIGLDAPLPRQEACIIADLLLVASKRIFFVVSLSKIAVLQRLALPFSAAPVIVVRDASILVKCDECIRVWGRGASDCAGQAGDPPCVDLRNLHRQLMSGFAVPPARSGQPPVFFTSSPEEIRGWLCLTANYSCSTCLLWTLRVCDAWPGCSPLETFSLFWLPSRCCARTASDASEGCWPGGVLVVACSRRKSSRIALCPLSLGCVSPVAQSGGRVLPSPGRLAEWQNFPREVRFAADVGSAALVLWSRSKGWMVWCSDTGLQSFSKSSSIAVSDPATINIAARLDPSGDQDLLADVEAAELKQWFNNVQSNNSM